MDVKGPCPKGPIKSSQNTSPVESKTGKFAGKVQQPTSNDTTSTLPAAVRNLRARFTKQDLNDSTKVHSVLNAAAHELMSELPPALQLKGADKQMVADWLHKDNPVVTQMLMSFLDKILK